MQGLSQLEQDEVGDVHHVVDGTQADGQQPLLQPFGRFLHLHACEGDARIPRSGGGIFHLYRNLLSGTLGKAGIVRTLQRARDAIVHQVGIQIAGDTPVGGCIHAVRGNFIFDDRLGLEVEVLLGGRSHHGFFRKDHDALVGGADSQLVLGTDHSEGLHAADLGFLDLEIAREHGSDAGEEHFLACRHVRGAADDRQRFTGSVIHGGDVQVIGIGMRFASEHLGHHHAGQAAGHRLRLFYAIHLDTDRGHCIRNLLRSHVHLKIILEPIVRKLHICNSVLFQIFFREKRGHEFLLVEDLQVVDSLSDADEFHRNLHLVHNADHHAALGRSVQLG